MKEEILITTQENEKLGIFKLILISVFWFSNTIFYTALAYIIIPKYVDEMVSNKVKGTVLGKNFFTLNQKIETLYRIN